MEKSPEAALESKQMLETIEAGKLILSDKFEYLNGFSLALGAGDVILTCLRQARPVITLNMSYTVAKTLKIALSNVIDDLERRAGHEMLTVQDVEKIIQDKNVAKKSTQ